MDWKGRHVLVTGGGGFIGSWVAMELASRGARVTIFVRDKEREIGYKLHGLENKVKVVEGNLKDYSAVRHAIQASETEVCFHIAAQPLVQFATESPVETFESNIQGTWHVMEACRTGEHVERIIVASSDKAYGVQATLPYTEDSQLHGLYPYDASKACTDIIARSYSASYGMNVAVTRNANIYGGGDLNFSRIVPDAIRCVLLGKKLLIRSDGTPERDYMYIKDAVSAYATLAENLHRKEVSGQAFNFGTGKPINVLELFKKIAAICGRPDAETEVLGEARNEIDRQYLSSEKARKVLGWKPKFTLDEGLRETVEWYRSYLKA